MDPTEFPGPQPSPPGSGRIVLERSGGFAGTSLRTEVDLSPPDDAEARGYAELLQGVDLGGLGAAPAGGVDRFHYDLSIDLDDAHYELSFGERSMPEELRPLVESLVMRARGRPL